MSITQIRGNTQLMSGTIYNAQIATSAVIAFSKLEAIPTTYTAFVVRETTSGVINNSNQNFGLANTPFTGSEQLFLNGLLQEPGSTNDYTISGNFILMNDAPKNNDRLKASYMI